MAHAAKPRKANVWVWALVCIWTYFASASGMIMGLSYERRNPGVLEPDGLVFAVAIFMFLHIAPLFMLFWALLDRAVVWARGGRLADG